MRRYRFATAEPCCSWRRDCAVRPARRRYHHNIADVREAAPGKPRPVTGANIVPQYSTKRRAHRFAARTGEQHEPRLEIVTEPSSRSIRPTQHALLHSRRSNDAAPTSSVAIPLPRHLVTAITGAQHITCQARRPRARRLQHPCYAVWERYLFSWTRTRRAQTHRAIS